MTDQAANDETDADPAVVRLAEEIRRHRKDADLSHAQLAGRIGYSRQYISLAERARKGLPSAELVKALDNALHADGTLVVLREAAAAARLAQRRHYGGTFLDGLSALPTVGARGATPRDLPAAAYAAAEESTLFLAWAEDENVGELTLEQLHSEIRRISHVYLKAPAGPLFIRTRQLRDRAFALLPGHHRPSRGRDLYAAAGWSLTILAWMSVDFGQPQAAEDHARAAWLCAERAEHDGLRAWVRATQHTAAFWQDDFERAARYATDGLRHATGGAALFLASAQAMDLARCGRDGHAGEMLIEAQRIAGTAADNGDELAGPFSCNRDRAGGLWSDTQLTLGQAEAALDHAAHAIETFEASPLHTRNAGSERMVRLQKVRAHLALDQLDEAEAALGPVLDTAPEHRMRPLRTRMNDVQMDTTHHRHRSTAVVDRMADAAIAFQR